MIHMKNENFLCGCVFEVKVEDFPADLGPPFEGPTRLINAKKWEPRCETHRHRFSARIQDAYESIQREDRTAKDQHFWKDLKKKVKEGTADKDENALYETSLSLFVRDSATARKSVEKHENGDSASRVPSSALRRSQRIANREREKETGSGATSPVL